MSDLDPKRSWRAVSSSALGVKLERRARRVEMLLKTSRMRFPALGFSSQAVIEVRHMRQNISCRIIGNVSGEQAAPCCFGVMNLGKRHSSSLTQIKKTAYRAWVEKTTAVTNVRLRAASDDT